MGEGKGKKGIPLKPAIVSPTSIEFTAVREGLKAETAAHPIQLAQCGFGEKQSAAFCQQLDARQISCLALIGWAGGLVPGLGVGSVICADSALKEEQPPVACRALPLENSLTGSILTSPKVLLTSEEKETARSGGAIAVEMEAYPMAVWASKSGIPFFHVRIILDTFEETLPDTGTFQDEAGRLQLGALLLRVGRQPGLLKSLFLLNRRVRELNPVLSRVAIDCFHSILAIIPDDPGT